MSLFGLNFSHYDSPYRNKQTDVQLILSLYVVLHKPTLLPNTFNREFHESFMALTQRHEPEQFDDVVIVIAIALRDVLGCVRAHDEAHDGDRGWSDDEDECPGE